MSTRRRDRSRSISLERPPRGVSEITEKDFFLKHDAFQLWLREEKDKYFTELSGEKARSYFRKFVKSWNRGRLDKKYYEDTDGAQRAASSTSYRWAFASSDKVSEKEIRGARDAVREATNNARGDLRPVQGPTLPPLDDHQGGASASDRQYEREMEEERRQIEQKFSRKRARAEDNDRIEDAIGPREVGRERMLENKRARREGDRAFREKDTEPDIDADSLMGGDSFQARLAQRDAARKRFEEKRRGEREAKEQASRDRVENMRQKDKATMEMFKALAKERFGN
ncbi:SubName: Full=Uncharacterized protein {ECO:0000313/EMBL:CCA67915.1} [Serendipita indica DSM 11827]|uniref:Splicing arginine serine-rich 12 n=1 Tax=Serendipita indica (strain DSM 11827) TaxID=1109443 RepID=G4T9B6_SERID|nr:SubName: Full=Uncharacterized protein {ECO:0000313/EMBL:CCA67915.1} [Serendipita indica DSM 11827]CCA67915.1 hypothetical protein PIIN_01784 [Serendipita indica DSM 11827]